MVECGPARPEVVPPIRRVVDIWIVMRIINEGGQPPRLFDQKGEDE